MACMRIRQKTGTKLCMVVGAAGILITAVVSGCKNTPAAYQMYTIRSDVKSNLRRWIDQQITEFEREYGVEACGPGLIFPIEELQSVPDALREWSIENTESERTVVFTKKNVDFVYKGGRPYCLSRGKPYFAESISVPPRVAKDLGLIEKGEELPEWICFLTTDDHWLKSFDQKWGGGMVRLDGIPELLFRLFDWYVKRDKRGIDLELMRLQRREALWAALLQACSGGRETQLRLRELRDKTDREFGKVFLTQRSS